MTAEIVRYDPTYPAIAQNEDWSCAPTSTRWALFSWGRSPGESWLETSMIAQGVVTTQYGLSDASGAGLAAWLNREYGELGFTASNDPSVSFDDVAAEAGQGTHPLCLGGRAWYHWTGCRGWDGTRLLLANPASGYQGVTQTLTRAQFASLGPFSMVRLEHPGEDRPAPPEDVYAQPGEVGTGIMALMAEDNTQPAMPSTFLPLGVTPSMAEQCWGLNGTQYVWHIPTGRHWRYPAA